MLVIDKKDGILHEVKAHHMGKNKPTKQEYTHPYRIYKDGKFSQCFERYSLGAAQYRKRRDKGESVELRVYSYGKGYQSLSSNF